MTLTLTRPHGRSSTDTPTPPPTDRGRAWLTRLFAGDFAFPVVQPAALAPAPDRPPAEADAAARAAGCRDLFVVDAVDRPARERVLVDVARAAVLKGERVLLLSPDAAAADRLVEMLAPAGGVVRALADDENPYRPSAVVNRLTSANAGTAHADRVIRDAAGPAAALEAKLAPFAAAAAVLAELRDRAVRFEQIEAEKAALDADPDPVAALRADHEAAVARLTADRDAARAKRGEREAELSAVRQHCAEATDAVKKASFFARLLGKGKSAGDPAELERHAAELEREIKELTAHESKLAGECDHVASAFAAECDRLRAARAAEVEAKRAALAAEADAIAAAFRGHRAAFEAAGFAAPWPTVHSVDTTNVALNAVRANAERELAVARQQPATLDRAALAREYLTTVPVVVGTPRCLHAEAVFAPPSESPPFGVLILDHAEELGEADFVDLSRVAERWVLVGNAAMPEEPKPPQTVTHRPRRPAGPTFVARLARILDREVWATEPERLVCRLTVVPPDRRRTLFREPVVDDAAIELRFTEGNSREAVLAEVAFPAGTPVATAKAYLASQLGESVLRPFGDLTWHHAADRIAACWPAAEVGDPEAWVDHAAGVREKVVGTGIAAFTAVVAFDPASGWDAEKAAAWLTDRLPAAPAGRLAVLPRDPSIPAGTTPRAAGV